MEWLHILSAEKPPLTLYQLAHEATMADVYDAIEWLEFHRYMEIEGEKISNKEG